MKKLISLLLLLAVSNVGFSQPTNTSTEKTDYLKKSKSRKTIAWLLACGGVGTAVIAYASYNYVDLSNALSGDNRSINMKGAFLVIGGITALSSIPFFISSSRNKRKSMSLSFKMKQFLNCKKRFCLQNYSFTNIKNESMKKIIVFTLLLTISATSFSQQTNPSMPVTKADYLQKSKSQKGVAWLLLGGGTAILAITTISNLDFNFFGPKKKFPVVPVGIGAACVAGSVPLFIASGRNKRKSMSLSFKNETVPQLQKSSFVYKTIPSLILKISL